MGAGSSVIPGETGAVLLTEGGAFLKFPLPRDLVVLQQACSIVCKHDPEGAALLVNALRKGLGQSHREDVSKGSKGSVSNAVASVPSKVTATGTTSTVGGDNDDTSPSQKNKGTDNDDEGENKANETSASSPAASDKVRQLQESVASLKLLLKERDEKIAHLQARWESESGLKHEFVVENSGCCFLAGSLQRSFLLSSMFVGPFLRAENHSPINRESQQGVERGTRASSKAQA